MLRTHRQRVPAMLAVACAGMMVYAVAGAAPDDGRQLAPAEATAPVAKSDKTTQTTAKDACGGSTPTTTKDGDGKGGSTPTTTKDGDGKGGSTPTTTKDGDGKGGTTPTTTKDGKDSGSTPTTTKDGDGKSGSTPTTTKDGKDSSASTPTTTGKNVSTAAAVKGDSTTATTEKAASGKDGCDTTPTTRKDRDTTSTTKDGDGKTTSTTRKANKGSTTTTTDRRDRQTTSTTGKKRDTVEPTTPSGGAGGGSGNPDSGESSNDPAATPIEPQEAPPDASADPGQGADPEAMDDPGAVDGGYSDMPEEGPVAWDEDEVAIKPMAAPGEAAPVIPSFNGGFYDGSGWKAAPAQRPSRSSGDVQQLTAPPLAMSSSGFGVTSSGATESAAVSRRLAGMQASATESAFPADIISTPKVFPINRRDPLAAAALILLIGVSRELFKAWRRQANDYWVA